MLTPINLGSHFFIFGGIAKESHGPKATARQLNNDGTSTHSPYDNKGRRRHDQWVPRPALRHP